MAITETFDTDLGNYTIAAAAAYEAALGNFGPGCVRLDESGASGGGQLSSGGGDNHAVIATDNFYFNYEITGAMPPVYTELRLILSYNGGGDSDDLTFEITGPVAWTQFAYSLAARDGFTLDGVSFEVITAVYFDFPSGLSVYIDSITVSDTPPAIDSGGSDFGFTRSAGGIPGAVMVS